MSVLSITEKLTRFPPIACRLLARVRGADEQVRPLTDAEIAAGSRLSVKEVAALSKLTSWDDVTVGRMFQFTRGCGIDLEDRECLKAQSAYLKKVRRIPLYLVRSPNYKTQFLPLLELWINSSKQ